MGLEYRKGKPYYYRKKRKGNKVISEYVCSGEAAMLIAELDKTKLHIKKLNIYSKFKEPTNYHLADKELRDFEIALNKLFTSVALSNGYHQHKRQWRKKRPKKLD